MSDQPPLAGETVSSSPEGITLRDKRMVALNMLLSVLDGSASLLKLYFGVQTGAIVLFVKGLTDVRAPTPEARLAHGIRRQGERVATENGKSGKSDGVAV